MRLAFAFVLALCAAPASAQTVESSIEMDALGWGQLDLPVSVETDGDLATREWLVRRVHIFRAPEFRIVAERGGAACAGPWFNAPAADLFTTVAIQRVGLVHKLVTRDKGASVVHVVALDTPVCEH